MRRLALPFLALAMPLPAFAAEITVEDFGAMTRITIPVTSEEGWVVSRAGRRIAFKADRINTALTAPAALQEGRLAAISVLDNENGVEVNVDFACDCESTHFYGEDGVVIVDVSERIGSDTTAESSPATNGSASGWNSARIEVQQPTPSYVPMIPAPPPVVASTPLYTPPTAPRPIPVSAASPPIVTPAEAATLLATSPAPRRKPPVKPAAAVAAAEKPFKSDDEAIDALREVVLEKLALGVEQGRITMDSGADRERKAYVPAGCPDEEALDLKRLTNAGSFREGLPALRIGVYDEMKQVNPAAVRKLARHFLAFGLGEEARSVIEAFGTKGTPERLILDMAGVLQGDGRSMDESILLKTGCGPRAGVWGAAVAAEGMQGDVRQRFDTAREAIYDVPGPLRKILGARIALGLIDEGDRNGAMRLWRNLETATGPRTPEMRLLAAYTVEGTELRHLLALSETRSPAAGEAATRAAAILLERPDQTRAERLGVILDDLAFIYRDTPEEEPLNLAFARLQAEYGDLASALTVLAEKAEDQPGRAEYWRGIAHNTIRNATNGADPIARPKDFDTILASLQYLDDTPESDAAKFSLARKLMNIGAAHVAETILTPKLLKRSDEAQRLMAEAKLLMGDAPAARAILKNLRDEDSQALTERTAEITAAGTADAARALFETTPSVPGEPSISAARDLMDETQLDMSIIEELLADG